MHLGKTLVSSVNIDQVPSVGMHCFKHQRYGEERVRPGPKRVRDLLSESEK